MLNNNLGNAYLSFALELKKTHLFSRSLAYYKKAIELDPEYPAPYHGLGRAYKHDGNREGAIFCWEKALEADPNFSPALFDLAGAYLENGERAKALRMLTEFKERNSSLIPLVERQKLDALLEKLQK
jgi:tetratricopeptide (TPR) repeat protein